MLGPIVVIKLVLRVASFHMRIIKVDNDFGRLTNDGRKRDQQTDLSFVDTWTWTLSVEIIDAIIIFAGWSDDSTVVMVTFTATLVLRPLGICNRGK